jgi:endonuclease/exonuclease/phosphatase (EEP) superfamily protein YafD
MQSQPIDVLRAVLGATLIALCGGCATVPALQQAFAVGHDGIAVGSPLPCIGGTTTANAEAAALPLPGPELRVLSWNLHKNDDPGWDSDLARFAAASDLLLIQEAALTANLQRALHDAGYDWLLASSFTLNDHETGVLSAARVQPASACVQRFFEPLLQLPKSAVITRYEVTGVAQRLAVANLHAINFTLGLGAYRAQLEAIARELAGHRGPVIVAGDFNTWSPRRLEVVHDVMQRLGLVPVLPWIDTRTRFLGHQVDHIYVRGLEVVHAEAPEVGSSDHNPVLATLRVAGPHHAAVVTSERTASFPNGQM